MFISWKEVLICYVIMILAVAAAEKQPAIDDDGAESQEFQDDEQETDLDSTGDNDEARKEEQNDDIESDDTTVKVTKKRPPDSGNKTKRPKNAKTKKPKKNRKSTVGIDENDSTSETSVVTVIENKVPRIILPSHIRINITKNESKTIEHTDLHHENEETSTVQSYSTNTTILEPIPTIPHTEHIHYMEVTEGGFLTVTSHDKLRMTTTDERFWVSCEQIIEGVHLNVTLKAVNVGYANLTFQWVTGPENYNITTEFHKLDGSGLVRQKELESLQIPVFRPESVVDAIFFWTLTVMVMFNTFMMGTLLDMKILIAVLKRPLGPVVGFLSQFLFMPLASWGIGWLLFTEMDLRLGLFCLGCCPGGSQSNLWTLLFNGDMNLSMTMTFISSIAAVGMMPFWFYTLGRTLTTSTLTVPFVNLIVSLILFTIPVVVGILVTKKFPSVTKKLEGLVKPITIFSLVVMFTLGIYANRYIFQLMTWQIILAGVAVAGGGYAFGALLAWIFRLGRPQIIAVSIETAFQNAGIAFLILQVSLSQPGGDLAGVPSISQLLVTSIPLYIFLAGYLTYKKIKARRGMQQSGTVERNEHDAQTAPMLDLNSYTGNIDRRTTNGYGFEKDYNKSPQIMVNQYSTYDNGYRKVGAFPTCPSPQVAQRLSSM